MKYLNALWFVVFLVCLFASKTYGQTDSLSLLLEADEAPTLALLPDRMLLTQRVFWGPKGLCRLTGLSRLTPENRKVELRVRRTMLVSHQVLGYATLGAMVAQGLVGARLFKRPGDENVRGIHEGLAALTNVCYFTTAGLSLLAPPPLLSRKTKGLNSIKAHKALAYVHFTGMVLTNVLAPGPGQKDLRAVHRAAAYSAFGAYLGAMLVMTF